jgi:putative transposase
MDGSRRYDTDLSDAAWALVAPLLPPARPGGRPRTTDLRAVVDAILYLLRTGCQWRLLPRDFPPWSTVHHYFRTWRNTGVWVRLHRALYARARAAAGRAPCPSLVIMDGQSVKTTERGGVRGFDGHKRVKGRKRHILVDTLGLPIANRVEPAGVSDRRAGARLLAGLRPLFPAIRTVMADAGHESRRLARELKVSVS